MVPPRPPKCCEPSGTFSYPSALARWTYLITPLMASPFRVFRKYQKTLLAVAGVVLMFVFVVGDSLFQYFGGSRGAARSGDDTDAKATAVHWDGGKLSNRQLDELVRRRRIL